VIVGHQQNRLLEGWYGLDAWIKKFQSKEFSHPVFFDGEKDIVGRSCSYFS
jgi:hypothetical protein